MRRLLLMLLVFLLPALAHAQDGLLVEPEVTRGYGENYISVTAPAGGDLLLRIFDKYNVYRTMHVTVETGENVISWDGLGENQERIMDGEYSLSAELTTADGGTFTARTRITFQRCHQAMTLALPSSDTLYQADEDWFVELDLVRAGDYTVEVYHEDNLDEPVFVQRRNTTKADPFKYRWKAKGIEPGNYIMHCYAQNNPVWVHMVPVTVVSGSAPEIPLVETETFMPSAEDTDETIWRVMMQPSAVIDMKVPTAHQEIYELPDAASRALGTVHSHSQALNVLDIRGDGWVRVSAWNHERGDMVEGYIPHACLNMVRPNSEYGLLLNKQEQTLTIYQRGKCLTTLSVSTGLMAKDKLFRETPAGSYLTLEHMSAFASEGYHYDYPIRYDGGNLLHQLGYKERSGRNDFSDQLPQLGSKASHGCVRLPNQVNGEGVNAYWLWTHLPYHTRLIILDDPINRMEDEALANAGLDEMPTDFEETEALQPLKHGETEIVITLGGDAVLGTRESWWKEADSFPAWLEAEGFDYPFSGVQDIFSSDDMTFVNLECVLKADAAGEDKTKPYRFRGLPGYTEVLNRASIEQVNIANNHYVDYGMAGKNATREALEGAGVAYSGAGYTFVWENKGHIIGFAGCRETTYRQDRQTIARDIAALKDAGCEVVIYSCHWGAEYSALHNDLQSEMADAAIASGADVVVGTHPHVVQGVDTRDGALLLYSLGNLMFGGTHDMTTFDGALVRLNLRFDADGYLGTGVELIPVLTSSSAPYNDFRPMIAEGEDKIRIMTKIQIDSSIRLREKMWFPAE